MAGKGKGIQIVVGAEYTGKDLERAQRDIAKLQKQTQTTTQKLKGFSDGMSKVGKNLTAFVTLPLVGIGAAAVAASVQFESSMAKITGLVGIAADEVNGMRDGVLDLAGETARAPQELSDALFVVTSAGLRGEEAMAALESSAKAATAGLGETKDIARALAGAVNAYGQDVLGAAEATDIIVATARAGNFETSQFAAAIGNILPVAVEAKASFADLGGAVALLTRTNGDAAKSATQVTALLRAFATPSATAQKAFADMGLSAGAFRDAIASDGLPAALEMLDKALGGNREELLKVLGSSEAVSAATSILNADAETLAATFGEVANSAGITDEAFGVMSETTGFKLQQAMSTLKTVLIEIGDILAPFVQRLADFGKNALEAFRNLPDGAQQMIVALGGVAAAIGPLLLIGAKLIGAVIAIKGAFVGVGGFAGIAAAVTGPVAIIIGAIVGVIAILVAMWRESEVFRDAVSNAFNTIRDAVGDAIERVSGAMSGASGIIDALRVVFKLLGDYVGSVLVPIWTTYLSVAIRVVSELIAGLVGYVGMLADAFLTALPYVLDFAGEVVAAIGRMVDFVLTGLLNLLEGLDTIAGWLGFGDALDGAIEGLRGFRDGVRTTMADVENGFRTAADEVEAWGDDTIESLDGYRDAAVRARGATDEYVDANLRAARAAGTAITETNALAAVTDAAAAATVALQDAYSNLSAFFSESAAIDRAHTLLQDFQAQVSSNSAGFDDFSDAAKANRDAFRQWAESQIRAAQGLEDPAERMAALADIQKTARDALREQGLKPSESGFYQEIKGIVDTARTEMENLGDAVETAETAGYDVANAVAAGITQGMTQQEASMNGAGLIAGDAVATGMNDALGVASPSQVAIEAARMVGIGLADGLRDMDMSVSNGGQLTGRTMIQGMMDGLSSSSGALYARVRAIVSAALQAAQTTASSGRSGSTSATTSMLYNSRGGLISGPGGPMSDQIPAMLSNGEFVVRAQAVSQFGPEFFDALNRGINPLAGMEAPGPSRNDSRSGGLVINGGINVVSAPGEKAEESIPRALRKLAFVAGI